MDFADLAIDVDGGEKEVLTHGVLAAGDGVHGAALALDLTLTLALILTLAAAGLGARGTFGMEHGSPPARRSSRLASVGASIAEIDLGNFVLGSVLYVEPGGVKGALAAVVVAVLDLDHVRDCVASLGEQQCERYGSVFDDHLLGLLEID